MKVFQRVVFPLALISLLACGGAQAASDTPVVQAASAVKAAKPALTSSTGKVVKGEVAATTGAIKNPGDNQYPNGTLPIPPKPKKEGLEAAGAIKAKAAQP